MRLGYARCSTDEQAEALAAQVARLQGAGCDRIVQELESGRSDDRPGLAEVVALVRGGTVKELLITRADRLGRHAAFADELIALCGLQGVAITAIDGGTIEAATPQGFLQARLLTTMAEVESRMLSQRLRKQFEVYRAQGRHLRRRKPFGYQGGPDHKLEPHREQWHQALQVLEQLRTVGSFTGVARRMPEWCSWTPAPNSLQAWFVNPVIRGHIGHQLVRSTGKGWNQQWGHMLYDQHQRLISEADWQDLAGHLRRPVNRYSHGEQREAAHGLTGLIRCAACGSAMRRNTSNGVAWWRCRHRLCNERGGIRETAAMDAAIAAAVTAADRLAALATMPPDEDPRIAAKRRDLEQLQALASRNPSLSPAVEALKSEIAAMGSRPAITPDMQAAARWIADPAFFSGASAAEQRALLAGVLESLQVGRAGAVHALPRNW